VLLAFAGSAVELELRVWIHDPKNGVGNLKSDVLLRIWDKFRANGVEFPYPQRDLHLKTPIEITLTEGRVKAAERQPAEVQSAPKGPRKIPQS
jgi:small-conductance mechanosensitive channel